MILMKKISFLFNDFLKLDPVNCLSDNEENDIFVNQNLLKRKFFRHMSLLNINKIEPNNNNINK